MAASKVRAAYLAGSWYPDDAAACRAAIEELATRSAAASGSTVRGLVGPHAGWAYSGAAAVHGYQALAAAAPDPDLVVIFGSHRSSRGPNTVFRGEGWQTPLGALETDQALVEAIGAALELDDEPVRPARPDNAVELHLPFVRYFFPGARLVMLGLAASPLACELGRRVGELVRAHGRRAVFVGSTDLTHYGPNYDFSPQGDGEEAVAWVRDENDQGFIARVLQGEPERALAHALANQSACCPGAVAATLTALAGYGHTGAPELVDHYSSFDVRPSQSFVGYASIVL